MRRARIEDARDIAVAHVRSWQTAYTGLLPGPFLASLSIAERTEQWASILAGDGPAQTWVAEGLGQVLGFVSVGPSRDVDKGALTKELWALYPHPAYLRRRVVSMLLARAENEMRDSGAREATWWMLSGNKRTRMFAEFHGWTGDGHTKTQIEGDVRLDVVRYVKSLPLHEDSSGGGPT